MRKKDIRMEIAKVLEVKGKIVLTKEVANGNKEQN